MFVIKRNQVIITALVVMIAVAGYLNYIDVRKETPNQMMLNDEGEISALVPNNSAFEVVNTSANASNIVMEDGIIGTAISTEDDPSIAMEIGTVGVFEETQPDEITILGPETGEMKTEPGEAIFVNTTNDTSYFVQARLEREQARGVQRELLTEMINNDKLESDKRAECADALLEIQKRIEKETAAEAMIESKGFEEVYVRIDDETVDVVVKKSKLSDAEIAQIEDIVKRKTGMSADKIRISAMKKQ